MCGSGEFERGCFVVVDDEAAALDVEVMVKAALVRAGGWSYMAAAGRGQTSAGAGRVMFK